MARDSLDRYYTPRWVVDLCFKHVTPALPSLNTSNVLEPSAGGGAFVDGIRRTWPSALATVNDIDPDAPALINARDARNRDYLGVDWGPFDLVIGNPPYKQAQEFVQHAVAHAAHVVFLLRLGFLAGARRHDTLYSVHKPAQVFVLPQRPSFTGDGRTDGHDYAFFCWDRTCKRGPTFVRWLPTLSKEQRC